MLQVDVRFTRGDFTLAAQFAAESGVIALFGRSGSGKTTLVNLLAGLLPGAQGSIRIGDHVWLDSAAGFTAPVERRRVGYVFQEGRLFPHFSVRGNLEYGSRRARGAPVAGTLAFDDVVALLGLGALLDRRPRQLSGGERQRVALGRALLSRPCLLLLDEPLASLDFARREEVLPYLERLRDSCRIPMIFVSHQFDEVLRLATQVAVLEAGRVVAFGPPDAVSLTPAVRTIVGPDAIGALLSGRVIGVDASTGYATLSVGGGSIVVSLPQASVGEQRRVQVFARDIILALDEPRRVSVRNRIAGTVREVIEDADSDLVCIDIGDGARLMARVTRAATAELSLAPGRAIWALVKAVSTRGHAY